MSRAVRAVMIAAVVAAGVRAAPADETLAARQAFFGHENIVDAQTAAVRADRVILSWFGVTNFAASINGHVVLLDAWVPRGEYSGYVPTSPEQLAALKPEFIFIGHGHFDHAAHAAQIAAASGATIVGTQQHCDQAREQAGSNIPCVLAVPSATPGTTGSLDGLIPGVSIDTLAHVHSAAEPHDPEDLHAPAGGVPNAEAIVEHPPAPQDTLELLQHLPDAEAGDVLYRFSIGDFDLTWHDTSGPLKERAPAVLDQLATLGETDVQMGAIMGFNQISNGMRDPRMYVERIDPKIFIPTHHDNWAPGITTRGEEYCPIIETELARIPDGPIVRCITDPGDYLRPSVLTFDPDAPFWS